MMPLDASDKVIHTSTVQFEFIEGTCVDIFKEHLKHIFVWYQETIVDVHKSCSALSTITTQP